MEFWHNHYEITPYTLAVIAVNQADGEIGSLVLDQLAGEIYVKHAPRKLIDQACKFFGSSLKGRQDGTRDVCSITHKAPIAIDPISGMYFFPTNSPISPNCSWVAHSHIREIEKTSFQNTKIIFDSGKSMVFDVSPGSIMNQIQRTAQFRFKLNERLQYQWKNRSDKVAEPYA